MKRLYVVALSFLACFGQSQAQFIADNRVDAGQGAGNRNETLVSPPGPAPAAPWKKEADQVYGHIRGSRLARMRALSEDIVSVLHDSVLTEGSTDPVWHGEYFSAANDAPQMRFGVSCVFPNEDAKSDRGSDLTLFANDISPLLGSLTVNGQVFVTLKGFTGGYGFPCFEFDLPADGGQGSEDVEPFHVKAWLVTSDTSLLPYIPVTRKEYLELAGQELVARKQAIIADIKSRIDVRTAAQQEADKQQTLDRLRATYTGAELQTRTRIFLGSYKTDEDYLEQHVTAATGELDRTLALIAKLLSQSSPQELALPAIVSAPPGEFRGFGDGRPGRTVLVRLRPAYYTDETAQSTLKSLLICWRYHRSDRVAESVDRQLAARNPVPLLRNEFYTVRQE